MNTPICAKCRKVGDLRTCARCESQQYCSRECQMAHWKEHKKICNENAATNLSNSSTPASTRPRCYGPVVAPKNLTAAVHEPLHKLDAGAWLHERPEDDVYKLLIDTFCLRRLDGFVMPGRKTQDGDFSELSTFKVFMELFESKQNLLPAWWGSDKAQKCISLSMGNSWFSIRAHPYKRDIVEHYGDSSMPDQMRILGDRSLDLPEMHHL